MAVTERFEHDSSRACIRALRELEKTAIMLETYAPEIFPEINEQGQKHFGRVMMESAAEAIRDSWATAIKFAVHASKMNGLPFARGCGRMADNDRAVMVIFDRALSDDELRGFHERIEIHDHLVRALTAATHALRSYEYGNAAPDLAASIADDCDAVLSEARGKGEA